MRGREKKWEPESKWNTNSTEGREEAFQKLWEPTEIWKNYNITWYFQYKLDKEQKPLKGRERDVEMYFSVLKLYDCKYKPAF